MARVHNYPQLTLKPGRRASRTAYPRGAWVR
ncbi:DUF1534 domain-containing protein [Pseudomonas syringae]|nr:DUF1534 domain-containing protein [Pseudomonas syringae]PYD14998.1 hypothetical protein DND47_15280 [Pseudomonas syringae pv. syringae]MCF5202305.1 DUF1534 domain-containing protein [Pseudomonas syringae]MCF5269136.1 DUF1534 domain-containing protein [Pseudomonas syringae]MCF5273870.1 DUF1534 domain-containing protein [Pseudomonas syringae]